LPGGAAAAKRYRRSFSMPPDLEGWDRFSRSGADPVLLPDPWARDVGLRLEGRKSVFCRSARRSGGTRQDIVTRVGYAIARQFGESRFVTALAPPTAADLASTCSATSSSATATPARPHRRCSAASPDHHRISARPPLRRCHHRTDRVDPPNPSCGGPFLTTRGIRRAAEPTGTGRNEAKSAPLAGDPSPAPEHLPDHADVGFIGLDLR
jgi:hypothetical protein